MAAPVRVEIDCVATVGSQPRLLRLRERLLVTGRILLANRHAISAGLQSRAWKPPDELMHAGA